MAHDFISEVSNHLEFLGYKVTKDDERSYSVESNTPDKNKPGFSFHPVKDGMYFIAGFPIATAAKNDLLGFLRLINAANTIAYVTEFTWVEEKNDFYAEACYPPAYDKASFATFITTFLSEIVEFFASHKPEIRKYFSIGNGESR
jgi:hypothetical protein